MTISKDEETLQGFFLFKLLKVLLNHGIRLLLGFI